VIAERADYRRRLPPGQIRRARGCSQVLLPSGRAERIMLSRPANAAWASVREFRAGPIWT